MLPLLLIVFAAFVIETVVGFGSTVLTVALASHFYPIQEILPIFIPANLLQSLYIVARHGRHVDRELLFRRILPWMGAGLPLGMLLFRTLDGPALKLGFALFLIGVSLFELTRRAQPRPLSRAASAAVLAAGGVIHGIYATGGPLLVYFLGRQLEEKSRFRATLSSVWLVLNLVLLGSYAASGQLRPEGSLALLAPLLLGIGAGEWIHTQVDGKTFRNLIFGLLLVSGVILALK